MYVLSLHYQQHCYSTSRVNVVAYGKNDLEKIINESQYEKIWCSLTDDYKYI